MHRSSWLIIRPCAEDGSGSTLFAESTRRDSYSVRFNWLSVIRSVISSCACPRPLAHARGSVTLLSRDRQGAVAQSLCALRIVGQLQSRQGDAITQFGLQSSDDRLGVIEALAGTKDSRLIPLFGALLKSERY